jgi:hypothetical protein
MKTPESSIENLFDGRLDFKSGSAFKSSPELRELQERYLHAKAEKQNMAVVGSCFALASPLMPLGFLSALFMLGKMDGMDKSPEELLLEKGRGLQGEMARIAAAEALMRKKRANGEDPESDAYIRYASRQLELRPLRVAMRPIKGAETRVIPKKHASEPSDFFITKEKQNKLRDIRKQRILLEGLMEKEQKEQNFSEACRLSSKLELLDKMLRKMGAGTGSQQK